MWLIVASGVTIAVLFVCGWALVSAWHDTDSSTVVVVAPAATPRSAGGHAYGNDALSAAARSIAVAPTLAAEPKASPSTPVAAKVAQATGQAGWPITGRLAPTFSADSPGLATISIGHPLPPGHIATASIPVIAPTLGNIPLASAAPLPGGEASPSIVSHANAPLLPPSSPSGKSTTGAGATATGAMSLASVAPAPDVAAVDRNGSPGLATVLDGGQVEKMAVTRPPPLEEERAQQAHEALDGLTNPVKHEAASVQFITNIECGTPLSVKEISVPSPNHPVT